MLDLLIKNGLLFDGTGAPPMKADIGIAAGRIAEIGAALQTPAREVCDADGLWVTPGFIDIHTHYDVEVEISPGLPESARHGVTTVVMGNCSLSLIAGDPQDLADIFLRVETMPAALVRKWLAGAVSWRTPREYLNHLRALPLGPNVAPLAGHSALRTAVMGLQRSLHERATSQEIARMRELAESALDAGCIGISVDMVHWHKVSGAYAGRSVPSHYADADEYRMLADVCRRRDAVFQVTPNPKKPSSFLLILSLCTGLFRPPLRATVLSALDMTDQPQLWRLFPFTTLVINRLLGGNLRFQTLAEPFIIYADGVVTPLFEEFEAGVALNSCADRAARLALWREPEFKARFKRDWERREMRTFHRDAERMRIVAAPDAALVGRSVAEVARARGTDSTSTLIDLLVTYDDELRWLACGANERAEVRARLMAHPHILPGFTDAGAHSRNLAFFDGALALLRQAASTGCMTPQQAIARVTGEPARWFNLEAGELRRGSRADLLLLHPQALQEVVPAPVEARDPALDGALRMVKRGSEDIVCSVYVAGREVVRDGVPLPALGTTKCGDVLTPHMTAGNAHEVQARQRNRIDDATIDHPFRDYWDVFILKHQHPANVAFHCAGVVMLYGAWVGLFATGVWWWLALVPLSQITGVLGHALFERSHIDVRDAVFSWRAMHSLNRMFVAVVSGRYGREIGRVRECYDAFLRAHSC